MTTHHPVVIGAPRDIEPGGRPALLQRDDDDFLQATLEDLRTPAGRTALRALRARATDGVGRFKLFQPIQRQFHVALIEAWCDVPGTPRIDPAKVDAAGLVLRRIGADGRRQGWMKSGGHVRGWVPLARVGGETLDPLARQRVERQLLGTGALQRQFAQMVRAQPDNLLDEDVTALYLAPPDVCRDAGKTLFYGIVSTTSGEQCEAAPSFGGDTGADFGPDSALFRSHLVEGLRGTGMDFPFAGRDLVAGWFDAMEALGTDPPGGTSRQDSDTLRNPDATDSRRMRRFIAQLRQLAVEFNAFGGGAEVAELKRRLQAIELPLVPRDGESRQRSVDAFDFFSKADALLLQKRALAQPLEMPLRWPALSDAATKSLHAALHGAMTARFTEIQARSGRFDEPDARYVLRAFVRLKPEGTCPARTVWSDESAPFVIAPWYDGAGAAPVQIPLPDPANRALLQSLKPNVAFVVPPSLQNLLGGSAKDLMEGKGSTGTLGITWICSFSIPIITICAFMALNILLSLFNIFFGWMAFFKICIPFPKFGNRPPER